MLIEVRCPNGHILHVREKYAGKIGVCPRCSAPVRVPTVGQASGDSSDRLGAPPLSERPSGVIVLNDSQRAQMTWKPAPAAAGLASRSVKESMCLECGRIVSHSFAVCPQCGTPVSVYRHLDIRKEGEVIVIQIDKPVIVDDRLVKEIGEELTAAVDRSEHHHVVLNMSKVTGLSSAMLGKLLMIQKRMELHRRRLKLCCVQPEIRDVLVATKLHRVLRVVGAELEAVQTLMAEPAPVRSDD